jgi:YVTN family beta-propeller protein
MLSPEDQSISELITNFNISHKMKKSITLTKIGVLFLSALFVLSSCEDDKPKGAYEDGVFITNEGAFGNNNGSVSFYSYGADNVTNNIFITKNERALGDVVQSICTTDEKAFIVVNNSNKVEVVDRNTFKEIQTIEDVSGPRYMASTGTKGYLSCWGDNTVKVIDLNSMSVSKSIPVGAGPEKMLIANNKLFVANAGGWGTDSTISVIDITTEAIVASIPVKYSPRDLALDKDGYIWALCFGKVVYDPISYALVEETPSMIYKIDATTNTVLLEIKLFDTQHPTTLDIDKDGSTLYFGSGFGFGGIYKLIVEGSSATATQIAADYAYGFAYDQNSDILFVLVAPDFSGAGTLFRYATDGTKLGEYSVGIGPNGASFKNAK